MSGEGAPESNPAHGQKLRAVGLLTSGIAHDFNNLLTAIATAAELILDRPGTEPATQEDVIAIAEAAERGAALVRQLLTFARRQTSEPRTLAINPSITALSGLLARLLGPVARLTLELEPEELRARIDPTQFDQLLLNLALNARDAMATAGTSNGALTIHSAQVRVQREQTSGPDPIPSGRYVLIEVRDTGPGIAPDVLPHIFEPFFTTRQDTGGTGLGLATVHDAVHQSGGFIKVESDPGGTSFRIYLPHHDGPAPLARQPSAKPQDTPVVPPRIDGRIVLLVDDEDAVRAVTARALRRDGWRVEECDSAESALAWLDDPRRQTGQEPPAALISDVQMPGLDGPGLIRAVRTLLPGLPAMLISGYHDEPLRTFTDQEEIAFLAKPYAIKALTATLRRMVDAGPCRAPASAD